MRRTRKSSDARLRGDTRAAVRRRRTLQDFGHELVQPRIFSVDGKHQQRRQNAREGTTENIARVAGTDVNAGKRGDAAEASARCTLACKTSDEALVEGGFSATAEVHLKINLATCKMTEASIEIVKTGGRFGDIVKGLETEIFGTLRRSLENNLAKLCER